MSVVGGSLDVVVIGGGPAGSSFSYHAAKLGLSVLLVDKRNRGEYKCCAGGIMGRAMSLVNPPSEIIERKINGSVLVSPTGELTEFDFGKVIGFTTYRTSFDSWMLSRAEDAGVKVLNGRKVEGVKFEEDSVRVGILDGETFKSQAVIGAFGVSSNLYEQISKQRPKVTIGVQMELQMEEDMVSSLIGDRIEFYFNSGYTEFGYCWIFPKRCGVSVGLVDSLRSKGKRERLLRFIKSDPVASKKLRGARPLPIGNQVFHAAPIPNSIARKTYGERFLLVGDAAGFTYPATSEGIYYALKSGELARTMVDAKEEEDFSSRSLQDYENRWKNCFGVELYRGKVIQERMFGRGMDQKWNLLVGELKRNDRLRSIVLRELSLEPAIGKLPLWLKIRFLLQGIV
jgi:geranylgeranyl reductase family protein